MNVDCCIVYNYCPTLKEKKYRNWWKKYKKYN